MKAVIFEAFTAVTGYFCRVRCDVVYQITLHPMQQTVTFTIKLIAASVGLHTNMKDLPVHTT
jgi:hypothetical protein